MIGNLDIVLLGGSSGSVGSLGASPAHNHVGTTDLADLSPMAGASAKTVLLCCVCSLLQQVTWACSHGYRVQRGRGKYAQNLL